MSAPAVKLQAASTDTSTNTVFRVLLAISLVHLINDSIQSVLPSLYPVLQKQYGLSFFQLGLISFAFNMTSSLIQPFIGMFSDRKPSPFILPLAMVSTFGGMILLAFAHQYIFVLLAAMLVGLGSAIFHPEGSKVAYLAAGQRRGLAQSIYQVGGNAGSSLGPVMMMLIFIPFGVRAGALSFAIAAAAAVGVQWAVSRWYRVALTTRVPKPRKASLAGDLLKQRRKQIAIAMTLLVFLVFARSWYFSFIANYYVFHLIQDFNLHVSSAQLFIFAFLAAGAVGTFFGGPIADRFGRRTVIASSMIGAVPLALLLPYANPLGSLIILIILGLVLLSSFSVTVVYAQELVPGKVGTVSGLITGLAFGMGAVGAVALGALIDAYGLQLVLKGSAVLPLLGFLTLLLPSDKKLAEWNR